LSFPSTARLDPALGSKAVVTGNPVREAILAARDAPFSAPRPGQPFRLLVVGGSQGARILAERVPAAAQRLPEAERRRLAVVQQCRPEDLSAVLEAWRGAGIEADCRPYLEDMPEQLASAHLVVARAGASTVAELAAIGRPSILIPFAAAADDHQSANAAALVAAGGAVALAEGDASPAALAGAIRGFLDSPEALEGAAAAARGVGVPDAARRLADLVEHEVRALAGLRPEGRA
ncbi:MAG: glycosyltransferase, partial [Sphingomonadaceae bacterium]